MSLGVETINPSTKGVIEKYSIITNEELESKIKNASKAFEEWKKNIDKRVDHFHKFAQQLRKEKETLALTATREMGKVIRVQIRS
jgi:acyl-CoA reductase-like NAD-dependent aldehyde dehydrogenase